MRTKINITQKQNFFENLEKIIADISMRESCTNETILKSADNLLPIIFPELDREPKVEQVTKYNSVEKNLLFTLQQQFNFFKEKIQLLRLNGEQGTYIVLTPKLRKTQIGRRYVSRISQVEFILMTPKSLMGLSELMVSIQYEAKNKSLEFQKTLQAFLAYLLPAQKTNFSKLWGMINQYLSLKEEVKKQAYQKELGKLFKYPDQLQAIVNFLVAYFQQNYNLQIRNTGLRQTRISEKRKKVKQTTLTLMQNSKLNPYFRDVEFDDAVTKKQLKIFEKEIVKIFSQLPKAKSMPALKLRKLGRFHAQGLYLSNENIIALDFRKRPRTLSKSPFSSFIHEYGHYLDYQFQPNEVLSNQVEFQKIRQKVICNLGLSSQSYVNTKKQYYLKSTELFARLFELYLFEQGVHSKILDNSKAFELDEYEMLKPVMKDAKIYFDHYLAE